MKKMNEKLRNGLLNLSLILVGIIIFFIILEIGLALNVPFLGYEQSNVIERGEYLYYPEVGLGAYSNRVAEHSSPEYSVTYSTNSIGFRDREHTIKKSSNVFRIVVLGDSYTQALQVPLEQSFPYLLEQKLNSNTTVQKEIEVINLGLDSSGTGQQYLILKHIGLEYKPDLVILGFLTGNDVRNNYAEFENNLFTVVTSIQRTCKSNK